MSTPFRRLAPVALSLGLFVLSSRGEAQTADANKQAEELFAEARAELAHKDFTAACPHLEQSLALFERAGTHLNLAECGVHNGHSAVAMDHLERALEMLPENDDRRAYVSQRIAALALKVGTLKVKLSPALGAAPKVELDGTLIAAAKLTVGVHVDAGPHEVVATGSDGRVGRASVTVEAKGSQEVLLEPAAASAAPPPAAASTPPPPPPGATEPAPPPETGLSGRRKAAIGVGAVGLAGFVVAGITGAMYLSKRSEIAGECPNDQCKRPVAQVTSGTSGLIAANGIAWGVGIAGVAGAALLWFWPTPKNPAVSVGVSPSSGGAALTVRGSF